MPSQLVLFSRRRWSIEYASGSDFISQYFTPRILTDRRFPGVSLEREPQQFNGSLEVRFLQDVRDAHFALAEVIGCVEAARRRNHDSLTVVFELRQQVHREIISVLHRQLRHAIERAFRLL